MDPLGVGGHVALGVDIGVEAPPGGQEILNLQGGDLDQPVPELGLEASGFSVEDNLARHFLEMPCFGPGINLRVCLARSCSDKWEPVTGFNQDLTF